MLVLHWNYTLTTIIQFLFRVKTDKNASHLGTNLAGKCRNTCRVIDAVKRIASWRWMSISEIDVY